MERFIKRLKYLIKKYKLDTKRLAKDIDISSNLIERILQGKVDPKAHILIKLAIYFSCTIDYLVGFSDNKHEYIKSNTKDKKKR